MLCSSTFHRVHRLNLFVLAFLVCVSAHAQRTTTPEDLARRIDAVLDAVGSPAEGAYLLGLNNRDLKVQKTDLATTARLADRLEERAGERGPFISESGIATAEDVRAVRAVGACGILVGESLLKSDDVGGMLDELRGA